jgi:hypothetical protein
MQQKISFYEKKIGWLLTNWPVAGWSLQDCITVGIRKARNIWVAAFAEAITKAARVRAHPALFLIDPSALVGMTFIAYSGQTTEDGGERTQEEEVGPKTRVVGAENLIFRKNF